MLEPLLIGFTPFVNLLKSFFIFIVFLLLLLVVFFIISFLFKARVNPFKPDLNLLRSIKLSFYPFDLMRWIWVDFLTRDEEKGKFKEFGFTFFVGRQGAGKTISMVEYLKRAKTKYPNCIVVANFKCEYADFLMKDWRDILNIRNDERGVIFAIDEIHSEYSAASWKDVPENLLGEISQQRKQRIKIIASAQFYARVAKPLREQGFSVVQCKTTFSHRLTSLKEYDALDYEIAMQNMSFKKLKPLRKSFFIQSDDLRNCYSTYEKIEQMKKIKFIPHHERVE